MRPLCLSLAIALGLAVATGCENANRTDNLAPVQHDQDQYPGNDNEVLGPPPDGLEEVGTIQSYDKLEDPDDTERDYNNIFKRDADDADFATYTTEDDLDMPHDADGDAVGLGREYATGTYKPEDKAREYLEYGSNRSTEPVNGKFNKGEGPRSERPAGGNQDAIGATGYANEELGEYYDTDEEDYGHNDDTDGGEWGSWYRPLTDNERAYSERVVRIGGSDRDATADYKQRYLELKERLYNIPENQQGLVYQPNNYSFDIISTWDGDVESVETDGIDRDYGNETAYDRAPMMGTGCEQADDPTTCASRKLDERLAGFLNDPRVLRDMQAAGINGVTFDVTEEGRVARNTVRVKVGGRTCSADATRRTGFRYDNGQLDRCERFARAFESALRNQSWTPATRRGIARAARVNLPLAYRQTAEIQDLDNDVDL